MENIEENPYAKFVGNMRDLAFEAIPASYRIGEVISASPLRIDVGGAVQESNALVSIYSPRTVSVTVNVETSQLHSHPAAATASVSMPGYSKGDMVLLVPIEDEQRYIILGKLVGL
ncbi:MAG: DUF2577 domain-containing protein [Oscillospiraceae bacterium]|nr:DUF2577 domain-containing protein [Oscillospiraceae bacterium]